jgi:hypothetical protein
MQNSFSGFEMWFDFGSGMSCIADMVSVLTCILSSKCRWYKLSTVKRLNARCLSLGV